MCNRKHNPIKKSVKYRKMVGEWFLKLYFYYRIGNRQRMSNNMRYIYAHFKFMLYEQHFSGFRLFTSVWHHLYVQWHCKSVWEVRRTAAVLLKVKCFVILAQYDFSCSTVWALTRLNCSSLTMESWFSKTCSVDWHGHIMTTREKK